MVFSLYCYKYYGCFRNSYCKVLSSDLELRLEFWEKFIDIFYKLCNVV